MKVFGVNKEQLDLYILNDQKVMRNRFILGGGGLALLFGLGFFAGNAEPFVDILVGSMVLAVIILLFYIYNTRAPVLKGLYRDFNVKADDKYVYINFLAKPTKIEINKIDRVYYFSNEIVVRAGRKTYRIP